ncbi:hypothetical protein K438DRAFT_874156 [Mycena galopus ATCC 62051]|nr:hypothetical protein K438DRAFT_874156 [Mycena galopus ATCC 62051]
MCMRRPCKLTLVNLWPLSPAEPPVSVYHETCEHGNIVIWKDSAFDTRRHFFPEQPRLGTPRPFSASLLFLPCLIGDRMRPRMH